MSADTIALIGTIGVYAIVVATMLSAAFYLIYEGFWPVGVIILLLLLFTGMGVVGSLA